MRSKLGGLFLALSLTMLPALPATAGNLAAAPTTSEPTTTAPTPTAEDEDTDPPVVEEDGQFTLDNAELRWGLTNESNNMSHVQGRFNFFSAGRIADPGGGAHTVTATEWKQSSGSVSIEKSNGTTYVPATWAGLKTTATNLPITSASAGTFSDHQFVFTGGTGTVDTTSDDATISWQGDVTVIYYSGYTFFYLSDPRLEIVKGVGRLQATLGGFASAQNNPELWAPLPETEVTVAELGQLDLEPGTKGFTISPKYRGVRVSGVGQVESGDFWGAFPETFVRFQELAGSGGFWVSSGSAFDEFKVPLDTTISYDARAAIKPVPPAPGNGGGGGGKPVKNRIIKPPKRVPSPKPSASAPANTAPANVLPPSTDSPVVTADALNTSFQQVTDPKTVNAASFDAAETSAASAWWLLGTILLTLAAASVAGTYAYSAASNRR